MKVNKIKELWSPNNSGKFKVESHRVSSLMGRMTAAKVKLVEEFSFGPLDDNRIFE